MKKPYSVTLWAFLPVACTPVHLGALKPTDRTYLLAQSTLEDAAAVDCRQTWVTGDPPADVRAAKAILANQGVRVLEGNPGSMGTSLEGVLWVSKGFWDEPLVAQAEILTHELVHYCDRAKWGHAAFEARYATSNGRWAMEVRAYAQGFATLKAIGYSPQAMARAIQSRVENVQSRYLLWDINPEQYRRETAAIWYDAAQWTPRNQ